MSDSLSTSSLCASCPSSSLSVDLTKRERDAVSTQLDAHVAGEAQKKKSGGGVSNRWTLEQDEALKKAVAELGHRNWMVVAERVPGRDNAQCLQRWNKVLKPGLVKGPWSVEEDAILMEMMLKGYDNWRQVSNNIPGRTAKQCRERWRNRLDPSINKSPFTEEEDEAIQQAYAKYGNRWTQIAELLPGRTEDAIKLRWKVLNPNQKTYTKLGRPRLLNTEDAPSVSTSPRKLDVSYARRAISGSIYPPVPIATTVPGLTQINLEPMLNPLEDKSEERMSEEDVMILNEFLRGHSNSSLESSSFKSLLSATSLRSCGDDIDSAVLKLTAAHSLSGLGTEELMASKFQQNAHEQASSRILNKMLSLGDTKSESLRSITADVEPDDSWINGGLTRCLSNLSVNREDGGDEEVCARNQKLSSLDSFEQQLASLNDTGSLLSSSLNLDDGDKTHGALADATDAFVNGLCTEAAPASQHSFQLIPDDEIPVHGLSDGAAASTDTTRTVTAQDFYSSAVPHDQLLSAHRFEI